MLNKPKLLNAIICEASKLQKRPDYISEKVWRHLKGDEGFVEPGSKTGEFGVGASFIIRNYLYDYNSHGFSCDGTKKWLSVFKMSGGANNLSSFDKPGAEKSYDYDSIPPNRILNLPLDRQKAIEKVNQNYIGKKIRVIARSAEGCTQYGGRYYLFSVED